METSLHRQLKQRYAADEECTEVALAGFRIDAISENGELIEIQHASLGALRSKVKKLLSEHETSLRIVKPIIARKRVTTLVRKGGRVKRSRMSPLRGEVIDLFLDLVHFSDVYPREGLTLEFVLVETEELRIDRARPTRRLKKYKVIDQLLVDVLDSVEIQTSADLLQQVPIDCLPKPFDTSELGAAIDRPRWFAQKVAYCLRKTKAIKTAGKRGNSMLYAPNSKIAKPKRKRKAA